MLYETHIGLDAKSMLLHLFNFRVSGFIFMISCYILQLLCSNTAYKIRGYFTGLLAVKDEKTNILTLNQRFYLRLYTTVGAFILSMYCKFYCS